MSYINAKWDYPTMAVCAHKLDDLRDASNVNKSKMDGAFATLAAGVQADVGRAFTVAYSERVSSIALFAQVLDSEAELLRKNLNGMQQADAEIAAQIRRIFSV